MGFFFLILGVFFLILGFFYPKGRYRLLQAGQGSSLSLSASSTPPPSPQLSANPQKWTKPGDFGTGMTLAPRHRCQNPLVTPQIPPKSPSTPPRMTLCCGKCQVDPVPLVFLGQFVAFFTLRAHHTPPPILYDTPQTLPAGVSAQPPPTLAFILGYLSPFSPFPLRSACVGDPLRRTSGEFVTGPGRWHHGSSPFPPSPVVEVSPGASRARGVAHPPSGTGAFHEGPAGGSGGDSGRVTPSCTVSPGQCRHSRWPRRPPAERSGGVSEPVLGGCFRVWIGVAGARWVTPVETDVTRTPSHPPAPRVTHQLG